MKTLQTNSTVDVEYEGRLDDGTYSFSIKDEAKKYQSEIISIIQ